MPWLMFNLSADKVVADLTTERDALKSDELKKVK